MKKSIKALKIIFLAMICLTGANIIGIIFRWLVLPPDHFRHLGQIASQEQPILFGTSLALGIPTAIFSILMSHEWSDHRGFYEIIREFDLLSLSLLIVSSLIQLIFIIASLFLGLLFILFLFQYPRLWLAELFSKDGLLKHNFLISIVLVSLPFLMTLRRKSLRRQSWKKLTDVWLKWGGVSAVSVGGFGFIGLNDTLKSNLFDIAISHSQLALKSLSLIYLLVVASLGFASLLTMAGRAQTNSDDEKNPICFFVPAFTFAWIGNVGLFVLFTNSVILTLWAHIGYKL